VRQLRDDLARVKVLAAVLDQVTRRLSQAAERLDQRQVDGETLLLMEESLFDLQGVLAAIDSESEGDADQDETVEPGDSNRQQTDSFALQLRLVRSLQSQLSDRTAALRDAPDDPETVQRRIDIEQAQRRLAEQTALLLRQMHSAADEAANDPQSGSNGNGN
jgi:uncharacterized protein YdiU (UPF0061 family)